MQVASPVLLLLRPQKCPEADNAYQAVGNLHDWPSEWDPAASLPAEACMTGEIHISQVAEPDRSQIHHFLVDSHSLRGLTLWKATTDKWYVLQT